MELIQPNDPMYFTETSAESYDQNSYKIEFNDGKSLIFQDYEQMRSYWFECARNWKDCKVIILDKKQKQKKTNGGFK
tara:strand:- start:93 stop:323 length:231 start_codon:yes stop_codon:yes gene_type:complete